MENCGIPDSAVLFPRPVEFTVLANGNAMREYVWLECTESGARNYRVPKETRGTERLELMKYCPKLRRHTLHKESRKK